MMISGTTTTTIVSVLALVAKYLFRDGERVDPNPLAGWPRSAAT